ncbi:phenylalanine--tRNA ligase beta subunit isoform X2 [Bombus terrestris]|uniref:Phenylalanine--tRNA ligase beta subunit n=1 Tax=Bombus terrestris TaxID=30195 RepID=A0A9B7HX12_BOMTE|nr:phenylalanine--tRNA ligase beta subunit isoform X2 [Bombus terrestris]
MPTINIKRDLLFKTLGKTYSDAEFQNLCFEFGLELDEVTTEKQMTKEQNLNHSEEVCEEVVYKIDIPANRYDLLCLEGLALGLLIFQKQMDIPQYTKIFPSTNTQKIIMTKQCMKIRGHIVAAVLRDVTFSKDSYNSFIDLQEKLHQNIGRKRTLVSIGTHDLDTVRGPFLYDARPPTDICFKPLNQEMEYTAEGIMNLYENHAQLKQYLHIIKDSPVYPVVEDSNGIILSLPPIINGDHSKITLNTKNILIECTATDLTKAKVVLDTIVCAFSQYCKIKYSVEMVEIVYPDEQVFHYPDLKYRIEEMNCEKAIKYIGIKQTAEELANLLSRMSLKTSVKDDNILNIEVPPTRHDVIHACDIYEDIAIAYGYNKIEKTIPRLSTTADEVARTTLIPGLLKTLAANKKMPLPHKLFEVSDIILKDNDVEVGARNNRHLCAVYCNKSDGFEVIHGLLDRILQILEVPWSGSKNANGYYLRAVDDPTFFPHRCAEILCYDKVIGKMGVLHPDVISRFELNTPCSILEIDIECFL